MAAYTTESEEGVKIYWPNGPFVPADNIRECTRFVKTEETVPKSGRDRKLFRKYNPYTTQREILKKKQNRNDPLDFKILYKQEACRAKPLQLGIKARGGKSIMRWVENYMLHIPKEKNIPKRWDATPPITITPKELFAREEGEQFENFLTRVRTQGKRVLFMETEEQLTKHNDAMYSLLNDIIIEERKLDQDKKDIEEKLQENRKLVPGDHNVKIQLTNARLKLEKDLKDVKNKLSGKKKQKDEVEYEIKQISSAETDIKLVQKHVDALKELISNKEKKEAELITILETNAIQLNPDHEAFVKLEKLKERLGSFVEVSLDRDQVEIELENAQKALIFLSGATPDPEKSQKELKLKMTDVENLKKGYEFLLMLQEEYSQAKEELARLKKLDPEVQEMYDQLEKEAQIIKEEIVKEQDFLGDYLSKYQDETKKYMQYYIDSAHRDASSLIQLKRDYPDKYPNEEAILNFRVRKTQDFYRQMGNLPKAILEVEKLIRKFQEEGFKQSHFLAPKEYAFYKNMHGFVQDAIQNKNYLEDANPEGLNILQQKEIIYNILNKKLPMSDRNKVSEEAAREFINHTDPETGKIMSLDSKNAEIVYLYFLFPFKARITLKKWMETLTLRQIYYQLGEFIEENASVPKEIKYEEEEPIQDLVAWKTKLEKLWDNEFIYKVSKVKTNDVFPETEWFDLNTEQELAAVAFCQEVNFEGKKLLKNFKFINNFWKSFMKLLPEDYKKRAKKEGFSIADFSQIYEYLDNEYSKEYEIYRRNHSAISVGEEHQILSQWKVPSTRLIPSGDHYGKIIPAIRRANIILNFSPPYPEGDWLDIIDDKNEDWLAKWMHPVTGEYEYIKIFSVEEFDLINKFIPAEGSFSHKAFKEKDERQSGLNKLKRQEILELRNIWQSSNPVDMKDYFIGGKNPELNKSEISALKKLELKENLLTKIEESAGISPENKRYLIEMIIPTASKSQLSGIEEALTLEQTEDLSEAVLNRLIEENITNASPVDEDLDAEERDYGDDFGNEAAAIVDELENVEDVYDFMPRVDEEHYDPDKIEDLVIAIQEKLAIENACPFCTKVFKNQRAVLGHMRFCKEKKKADIKEGSFGFSYYPEILTAKEQSLPLNLQLSPRMQLNLLEEEVENNFKNPEKIIGVSEAVLKQYAATRTQDQKVINWILNYLKKLGDYKKLFHHHREGTRYKGVVDPRIREVFDELHN